MVNKQRSRHKAGEVSQRSKKIKKVELVKAPGPVSENSHIAEVPKS
jgi:hypothetical protein